MPRAWVTTAASDPLVALLVQARTEAGLSQRGLAERLGKPRSFVSKIETKERRIDVLEFIEWAEAVDVSPNILFEALVNATRVSDSKT